MNRRKKQQICTITLLCVILAGAAVGCVFADKYKQKKEAAEENTDIELYTLEENDIVKLHYANSSADLTLVKENDVWKLADDEKFPVEQSAAEKMAETVAAMNAKRVVTKECEDLSQYELDEPVLSIAFEDTAGKEYHIYYGMESTVAGGSYAYTDSEKEVYIMDTDMISEFQYTRNQLMQVPELPQPDEDELISYTVKSRSGETFHIVFDEEDTEETDEEKDKEDEDKEDADGETEDDKSDLAEELASYLIDLCFEEGVSYEASSEELEKYYLKNPEYVIMICYKASDEEKLLQLEIGSLDDSGYYYASCEGEKGIYLLDAETVENLISVSAS